MILLELFCLLIKIMNAAFRHSFEVMRILAREKERSNHSFNYTIIFLNTFQLACGLHDAES